MAATVTYLAEVREPCSGRAWHGRLDRHELRQPYAEPGGPAADLAWAESVLDRHGMALAGAPVQIRSWNLSSVWRIPVAGQMAWLKVVPPFFAHEGSILAALAGGPVPRLLGHDGGRMLLAELPGEDMYEAALPKLLDMVTLLVTMQARGSTASGTLQAMGLPDWRGPALTVAIASVLDRSRGELPAGDAALLGRFVAELPRRFAEIASCGMPDTLVHGDFHPAISAARPAGWRCSTGATAASAIPCWTSRPSSPASLPECAGGPRALGPSVARCVARL